jgi:FMN phosphatase YigB (HAD superfamily)
VSRFKAVLFDWKGTLFRDESHADWLRNSAESIGWHLESDEMQRMLEAIGRAVSDPRVSAAQEQSDCSVELNRAASRLLLEEIAGLPAELASAIWQRDGDVSATVPYPDTACVLQELKLRRLGIAVVSDIHYDLQPRFAHYELDRYIDAYVLSYQHGVQKPDPRLFQLALNALGVDAGEALMVGDRPHRDAGGLVLGITTLLLPPAGAEARRGLDIVLTLVDGR